MGKFKIGQTASKRVEHFLKSTKAHKAAAIESTDIQVEDLVEGIPSFSKTSEGLVQYVKYNNVIYEQKMTQYQSVSPTAPNVLTPDYDSGWTDFGNDTSSNNALNGYNMTFTHDLNSRFLIMEWYGRDDYGGWDNGGSSRSATDAIYHIHGNHGANTGDSHEETSFTIEMTNKNSLLVAPGNDYFFFMDNCTSNTQTWFSKMKIRLLAWRTGINE